LYVNTANITIDIENQWLPQLVRERDTMILDHAIHNTTITPNKCKQNLSAGTHNLGHHNS
jgi:hypothetical protein